MALVKVFDENLNKEFLVDEADIPDETFSITKDNCRNHFYDWYKNIGKYPYIVKSYEDFNNAVIEYLKYLGCQINQTWIDYLNSGYNNRTIKYNDILSIESGELTIEDVFINMLNLYDEFGIPKLKPYSDWSYDYN